MVKRAALAASVLAGSLLLATSAIAAAPPTAPGQNKLQCFDGTTDGGFGGLCSLVGNGAKGPATLDNTDDNAAGDYAGVYVLNSTLFGASLGSVTQLGYNYTGTIAPQPGNLSLNVPVDTDSDVSTTEGYAFIDAYYCPGTDGVVDAINDANCGIWYLGVEYANWAAFVAAFPDANVADNYSFVIAERTPAEPAALWTVNNVKLGKGGK